MGSTFSQQIQKNNKQTFKANTSSSCTECTGMCCRSGFSSQYNSFSGRPANCKENIDESHMYVYVWTYSESWDGDTTKLEARPRQLHCSSALSIDAYFFTLNSIIVQNCELRNN